MNLEDLRLFARVAETKSFTAAARTLGVPKQTLSRRVAELERALDVRLLHRTMRRLHLTEAGAALAERSAEIVRMAEDARRAVTDAQETPKETLRVTADPVFGEAFVGDLVALFARRHPEVQVEVVLTRRRVDLVEEGFDVAFRVAHVDDASRTGTRLGVARVRYCASRGYVARRGEAALARGPRRARRHRGPDRRRPRRVAVPRRQKGGACAGAGSRSSLSSRAPPTSRGGGS